jgi:group I intron endonuclease
MTKIYKIYKLTFPNKKIYIGMTSRTIKQRIKGHIDNSKNPKTSFYPLYRVIKKFGINNVNIEIIYETNNFDDINEKEIYFIKFYDSLVSNKGYNIQSGGYKPSKGNRRGTHLTKETKEKISKTLKEYFSNEENRKICKNAQQIAAKNRSIKSLELINKNIIDMKINNEKLTERKIANKCKKSQFFIRYYKLKGLLQYEN